jgi:hypothetical protein
LPDENTGDGVAQRRNPRGIMPLAADANPEAGNATGLGAVGL